MIHLTVLNKTGLWLLFALIPLIYMHLYLRRKSRPVTVSHLPVWNKILSAREQKGRVRLRHILLFLLRFSALCMIIFSVSAPILSKTPEPARHVLIIMDNSAGTAAVDETVTDENTGAVSRGKSRLAALKNMAEKLLDKINLDTTTVSILSTAEKPVLLCREISDRTALNVALRSIEPALSSCGFMEGTKFARELFGTRPGLIYAVFSDFSRINMSAETIQESDDIRFFNAGTTDANIAISSAHAERIFLTDKISVFCRIENFSKTIASEGVINYSFAGEKLHAENLRVGPRGQIEKEFVFTVRNGGFLKIELAAADYLMLDNIRFLYVPPASLPRVIIVISAEDAQGRLFWESAIGALGQYSSALTVTPERFSGIAGELTAEDIVIFSDCSPPIPVPNADCLYINAEGGNIPVRTGTTLEKPVFWNTNRNSALMENVDLRLLKAGRALEILPDSSQEILLSFTAGIGAVRATTPDNRKYVYTGFGLKESNLGLLAAFPIFIKNSFRWFQNDNLRENDAGYGYYDAAECEITPGISVYQKTGNELSIFETLSLWKYLIGLAVAALIIEFIVSRSA